jgi:hypothetical protein
MKLSENYQLPVFFILTQGSCGGNEPFFWINSMEILSGDLINAMCPS